MTPEQIMQGLQYIKDDYLLEAKAPAARRNRTVRPGKIALIAACLCVALLGTAFAAEIAGGGILSFFFGQPSPIKEEENKIHDGFVYQTDYENLIQFPVSAFPEDVQNLVLLAEEQPFVYNVFSSWDEAEKWLGIPLPFSSFLESAEPISMQNLLGQMIHCTTSTKVSGGLLQYTSVRAYYRVQPGSFPVDIAITASVRTEHDNVETAEKTFAYPRGTELVSEQYLLPSGTTATIVSVESFSGITDHYALFLVDGIDYEIRTTSGNGILALTTLKQVLDTFQ